MKKNLFKLVGGGGNGLKPSHNHSLWQVGVFNNLALLGEKKFVSELKRTYKLKRPGATHVAICDSVGSYYRHWCGAFTLAEVLITLGIIGVVAALTMPTLIAQHRKKALQTALLKTYSELQQANLRLLADDEHLYEIDSVNERRDLLMKEFKGYSLVVGDSSWQTIARNLHLLYNGDLKGHNGETENIHPVCDNGGISTDSVGRLWLFNDSDKQICVDVNGVKGPNRYGYDYFVFYPTKDDKIVPHYTNKDAEWYVYDSADVPYAYNDYTFYAVTDQHPTEKGKTYWGDYIKF